LKVKEQAEISKFFIHFFGIKVENFVCNFV